MAPVAGFVPEIVTNVLKSPFFRRAKTPRKGAASDNADTPPPEPQAGPSEPAVLQTSPRVAMLENQAKPVSAESVKEPSTTHPASFASFDSLTSATSANSLKSELNSVRMRIEPIIEQPTPAVTPNVSPPQKANDAGFPAPSRQNSLNVFPSPTTVEKPQAHIANDPPSTRTVTFLTAARAGSMRTGVSYQSFGSPYPPSVEKMGADGSADMSISSEDEPSAVFATPPATPTMGTEFQDRQSPPAVVLVSPSSERGLVLSMSDAFCQPLLSPRASASIRTASESTSDSQPSGWSRSSTGHSSDTGNTSLPATPLESPPADGQTKPTVWIGEHAIEPIGIPLPTTYAEARSLANTYPEIAEEILKRPLGPSRAPSRAPSVDSRPAVTPSSAPTSDADDADDERSQIRSPPRRREHSPDHPNWALAPDEGRARKRQRGRGRERQTPPKESGTPGVRGGKQRNRRARGRKFGAAASLERLHMEASASEREASPAQVMVEALLRAMGTREASPSGSSLATPKAGEASRVGDVKAPSEASQLEGCQQRSRTSNLLAATVEDVTDEDDRIPVRQAASKGVILELAEQTRSDGPSAHKARGVTEKTFTRRKEREQTVQASAQGAPDTPQRTDAPRNERNVPPPSSGPDATAFSFSPSSQPFVPSAARQPFENPAVKLPSPGKTPFSPFAPEFVPGRVRTHSNGQRTGGPCVLSSPTPHSGFTTGASPFMPVAATPAAAAIVNIASHAHSSAAALAKRTSEANLAGVINATAPANIPAANAAVGIPALFSPPIANVTAAAPPSMMQPGSSGSFVPQSSFAPPLGNAFRPSLSMFAQPTPNVSPPLVPLRAHSRRGSTASLSAVRPAFVPLTSQSPASFHPGLSKRASMASLHGIPPYSAVPSPLSRQSPIIGQTVQMPEARPAPFTPPLQQIYAPTPLFGGMSKRPSVANLAAAAAAATAPFVPPAALIGQPIASSTMSASSATSGQSPCEPPASSTPSPPSYAQAMPRHVIYETPSRPGPVTRGSSPAFAWTPATRPVPDTHRRGAAATVSSRNHTTGGALPGYDISCPAVTEVDAMPELERASPVDDLATAPPSVQSVASQVLDDEDAESECAVATAGLFATSLVASTGAVAPTPGQVVDPVTPLLPNVDVPPPASPSVTFTPLESEIAYTIQESTSAVLTLKDPVQDTQPTSGTSDKVVLPEQVAGSSSGNVDSPVGIAAAMQSVVVNGQEPTSTPVRPPTPGGQTSLSKLVAQLQLGDNLKDTPLRATSVVPSIHAGTPEQPVHWTIDEQGKLRAKKAGDGQSESEAPSQPQVQQQPAAPPLPRRRLGREQPDAFKPYFQNAGPANPAQANERFAGLRRRSMHFARGEGGIREADGGADRDGSPKRGWRLEPVEKGLWAVEDEGC
ncbi:hypothetical protein EVJ58_g9358 [Rhodofomes roseus]|uniref:Uncharacterized protein n=1 Tax=Rhodofomes roseus TaxID=34475 RepID=A0A4Y9XV29_9APHY|nr:hypothetical protein EVJ58_g9358 [Rhodofomes roseus]